MKKVLKMIVAMLACAMMLGSFAMAESDLIQLTDVVAVEEGHVNMVRVAFHDFDGNEVWYEEVEEGGYVSPMAYPPTYSDYTFGYWFDGADAYQAEFAFDKPVYQSIALYPFYIAPEGDLPTIDEVTATPEAPVVDIMAIIQGETSVKSADEAPMMTLDDLINQVASAPVAAEPAAAMSEEAAQNLINDILGLQTMDAADEVVTDELVADVIEDEDEDMFDEDELFTIEDEAVPMAGPAVAAQPYVVVSYDYDGAELTAGTRVTVRAELYNVPSDWAVSYQWQNDANGSFQDVAGATSQEFSFVADGVTNTDCNWQVNVAIAN